MTTLTDLLLEAIALAPGIHTTTLLEAMPCHYRPGSVLDALHDIHCAGLVNYTGGRWHLAQVSRVGAYHAGYMRVWRRKAAAQQATRRAA